MRHIVFVDDDPAVLAGLRRMLRSMRTLWRMSFVPGGAQTLELLADDPADVLVSDMRMPGMDGAELLTAVQRRWPETVRIILSGYADQEAALRAVPVAHRFLDKPCDPAVMSAALLSATDLRDRLAGPELRRLVGALGGLPSAPRSFEAITEAVARPDATAESVIPIIERDPSCSLKLLQLVNSAFFGLPGNVTSVREAVARLGLAQIRKVLLASGVTELFQCPTAELATAIEEINRHSLRVAALARGQVPPARAQEAFLAGILHDIGHLVLATVMPQEYHDLQHGHVRGADQATDETACLGVTHAEVGAYLLRLWGLPFPFADAAARHHDPAALNDPDPVMAAIALAETHSTAPLPERPEV